MGQVMTNGLPEDGRLGLISPRSPYPFPSSFFRFSPSSPGRRNFHFPNRPIPLSIRIHQTIALQSGQEKPAGGCVDLASSGRSEVGQGIMMAQKGRHGQLRNS